MLGQFFDRLNIKAKNSEGKLREKETRTNTKILAQKSTLPHQNRIASLSPESTAHTSQLYFRQYSPVSTSRPNSNRGLVEESKGFNPANIVSKRYGEDRVSPRNAVPSSNRQIQPVKPEIQKDKPKTGPNFEFRPLDKESFTTNSPNMSIKEGSVVVVQSIRPSQMISASKILFAGVRPLESKSPESKPMTTGNKVFKPLKEAAGERSHKPNSPESYPNNHETASQKRQHAWQEWWTEKKKNNQQLLDAARTGNVKLASQLLDKKKGDLMPNVNNKGENDWTPLHFACLNGDLEMVTLLLQSEANIDSETTLKFTPIHVAAQKGHAEIVQLLANSGGDINCKDLYNNTAIHYACQNDHKRIVQLLLSKPSLDLNVKNNDNKLPSDLTNNPEIKKLFDIFSSEKNLLSSNFITKVTIHQTKAENIQQMFEASMNNSTKLPSKLSRTSPRNAENDSQNKKLPNYGNYFTASGDTKSHSSLNTNDSEVGNNDNNFEEEKIGPQSFIVHTMLGKGSFGEVYLVEKKNTNTYYAMKVLTKSRVAKNNLVRYVLTERNVLSITNHPFIVKLKYAFQTADRLFLILDYCPGGDLSEHLQKERRFTEERAKMYLAEIVLALEDLHKRDIIFRDLKPDNIVLDASGHAMLTDFGLSKEGVLDQINGARSFCGSVAYLAPEMLKRVGHGKAVDWYLLGVVFYEMLVGVPPYYANNREELFANIERAPLKVPSKITPEAKALLIALLQRNPTKRLGSGKGDAEEVKAHPFFAKMNWDDVEKRKLKVPIPEKRINFAMKMPINPFGTIPQESLEENHITGWSFIAPQQANNT